ncbi:MAG: hypothetical protein R3C24_01750 [Cyanobacteriota/Melainabacteria group bacterium]
MFDQKITDFNTESADSKDWVFLAHDQLNDGFSLLVGNRPLLLIENHRYFSRRPYHKQKLALVLTNQRVCDGASGKRTPSSLSNNRIDFRRKHYKIYR